MRFNATENLTGYDGEDVVDQHGNPVKVRTMLYQALNDPVDGMPWTPDTLMQAHKACRTIYDNDEPEISTEDAALILQRSARMHSPIVYGKLRELLDPTDATKADGYSDEYQ